MEKVFPNTRVIEKVWIFSHTISNALRNFVSQKSVIWDEKDPTWFNSKTKSLIQEKNSAYELYRNNITNFCFGNILNFLKDSLKNIIQMPKQKN